MLYSKKVKIIFGITYNISKQTFDALKKSSSRNSVKIFDYLAFKRNHISFSPQVIFSHYFILFPAVTLLNEILDFSSVFIHTCRPLKLGNFKSLDAMGVFFCTQSRVMSQSDWPI